MDPSPSPKPPTTARKATIPCVLTGLPPETKSDVVALLPRIDRDTASLSSSQLWDVIVSCPEISYPYRTLELSGDGMRAVCGKY